MKVIQIVAKGLNNEIGSDNKLLWSLPNDLKMFKNATLNNYVLMGRRTFESCGNLPNRENIIVTNDKTNILVKRNTWVTSFLKGTIVYLKSLTAGKNKDKTLFIIGGQSIYEQTINYCDEIWITEVIWTFPQADKIYNCDLSDFKEYDRVKNYIDDNHAHDYHFVKYKRV